MPSRAVRYLEFALVALATCACASQPDVSNRRVLVDRTKLWPELANPAVTEDPGGAFPARRPTPEQFRALAAAERDWRARNEDAWVAARDQLCGEPVPAFWLTRLLVRDVVIEQRWMAPGVAALVTDPPWERPLAEIVVMGDAAAPCITLDLLCDPASDRRRLGSEILSRMGPEHLPAWERIFGVDDPKVRRAAVETIAAWGIQSRTEATLLAATGDDDFGVRAAAWRAFGDGSAVEARRLRDALVAEQDPFVRRAIIDSLSTYVDRDTALALVAEFQASLRARDPDRIEACQRALRKVSGHDRDESLVYWQNWANDYRPASN